MKKYIKSTIDWYDLSPSEQMAVEYASQAYEGGGYNLDDAVRKGCNQVSWGNVEPEYEDEDFYGAEPNEENVFNYLFDKYTREGRNIYRSPYINASTKVYSAQNSNSVWYRCVPKGGDLKSFNNWELGIHCGSKEQAQEICHTKYHDKGDIYEIILKSNVTFSNPVSDYDSWYSVEAVAEILSRGFGASISRADVAKAYRDGEWDKSSAWQYIIKNSGVPNPIVTYNNEVELNEQDIILDPKSIQSAKLITDITASNRLVQSVRASSSLDSQQQQYVYRCLQEEPEMPEGDPDDFTEAWSEWFRADIEYKHRCFADAVEDGIFEEGDYDSFSDLWDKVANEMAAPWS